MSVATTPPKTRTDFAETYAEDRKEYFRKYYHENKAKPSYNHNAFKYAKLTYHVSNEDCDRWGPDRIKDYGKLKQLIKKMIPDSAEQILETINN